MKLNADSGARSRCSVADGDNGAMQNSVAAEAARRSRTAGTATGTEDGDRGVDSVPGLQQGWQGRCSRGPAWLRSSLRLLASLAEQAGVLIGVAGDADADRSNDRSPAIARR
jgi:hypothetical protein